MGGGRVWDVGNGNREKLEKHSLKRKSWKIEPTVIFNEVNKILNNHNKWNFPTYITISEKRKPVLQKVRHKFFSHDTIGEKHIPQMQIMKKGANENILWGLKIQNNDK